MVLHTVISITLARGDRSSGVRGDETGGGEKERRAAAMPALRWKSTALLVCGGAADASDTDEQATRQGEDHRGGFGNGAWPGGGARDRSQVERFGSAGCVGSRSAQTYEIVDVVENAG